MQICRVYLAGPIGKNPIGHAREAILLAHKLRKLGFYPYVPHLSLFWDLVAPCDYEEWMDQDFAWISACNALLRFGDASPGADREVEYANRNNILVVHSVEELVQFYPIVQELLGADRGC